MHLRKILITLLINAFLLVGATGVAYSGLIMGHSMDGMGSCPLMGHSAAVCNMNPLDHLNAWQNLFAATTVESTAILLLVLLALFLISRFSQYLWLLHPSPQPVYISYNPEVVIRDPLQRFIARGLLHPKIF